MTTAIKRQSAVKRRSWKALESHHTQVSTRHLRELFAEDPKRGERLAVEAVGLYLDYSKNRISGIVLEGFQPALRGQSSVSPNHHTGILARFSLCPLEPASPTALRTSGSNSPISWWR
jgi:hypothetical protein